MTAASKRAGALFAALLVSWCAALGALAGFGDAQGAAGASSGSGGFTHTAITADATLVVGRHTTNIGASGEVIGTLPDGAIGDQIQITVMAAQPFRVKAPTGVTILTGAGTTASAGYVRSSRVSSSLTLTRVSSTAWVTESSGTWAKDSTTSAGYAYTPTDWTSYTPDTGWTGGNVTQTGSWSQTGRIVRQRVRTILSGAPTGTYYLLQPVVSVDTTAMDLTAAGRFCGSGMAYDSGTSITWLPAVLVAGTFRLQIATTGAILAASGGWGASDEITVEVEFVAE